MGDMADYYLECNDSEARWEYEREREDSDGPPIRTKICRCCGTTGLFWIKHKGKWRLGDAKYRLHICPVNPLTT